MLGHTLIRNPHLAAAQGDHLPADQFCVGMVFGRANNLNDQAKITFASLKVFDNDCQVAVFATHGAFPTPRMFWHRQNVQGLKARATL
jgi:hypothetical protein